MALLVSFDEDVYQIVMLPADKEQGSDAVLFAKGMGGADILDLQPVLLRQAFRNLPDLVAEGFREKRGQSNKQILLARRWAAIPSA